MRADFRGHHAGQRMASDLNHRNGAAGLLRGRRDLEPDESCADHGKPDACLQAASQRQRVIDVADIEDSRVGSVGRWKPPCARARRQQERIVGEGSAFGELEPLCGSVDAQNVGAQPQIDARCGIPVERMQVRLFHRNRSGQQFFGQRRSLVRRVCLRSDDRDPAGEACRPHGCCGAAAGVPGADDDDMIERHSATPPPQGRRRAPCAGAEYRAGAGDAI